MNRIFTSESVSIGHPDKLADQISDGVLDEFLRQDREAKVACETFITDGLVIVGGEATANAYVDVREVAKKVLKRAGYTPDFFFDPNNFGLLTTIHEQSPDIRQGVVREEDKKQGAGDQGIMFGYAVNEGKHFMPITTELANRTMLLYDVCRRVEAKRGEGLFGPDAKCQYSVLYDNGKPVEITNILMSMQHRDGVDENIIKAFASDIVSYLSQEDTYGSLITNNTKLVINPTGKFVIGGPKGDTGLTGRKIIVDTYGGRGAHGGGAFSGKDPSKVDRSAAYMARYLAKNIVASKICDECLIQLSYMIGVDEPSSIYVKTDKGEELDQKLINYLMSEEMKPLLTPYGIITTLNLKNPIYRETATFGHFGRSSYVSEDGITLFPWEKLDLVDRFKEIK